MRADNLPALSLEHFAEDRFHFCLFGPTFLIGRKTKIAIGHQVNVFGSKWSWCVHGLLGAPVQIETFVQRKKARDGRDGPTNRPPPRSRSRGKVTKKDGEDRLRERRRMGIPVRTVISVTPTREQQTGSDIRGSKGDPPQGHR